jgi:hypothetical protein
LTLALIDLFLQQVGSNQKRNVFHSGKGSITFLSISKEGASE